MNKFFYIILGLLLIVAISGCITKSEDTNTKLDQKIQSTSQTDSLDYNSNMQVSDLNIDQFENELNSSLDDLNSLDSLFSEEEMQ